ncbi:SDR family NAD(P)-dependent oxidoreductase [Mesorhizobium sp. M8A.F.Ca.ET.173.01.1.1]|nr:SDR family NAD(P)-dependent oxidoreductase [Mesorhizobium sp. M8A.F.Ca.ET.173.01.1.1]
MSDPSRPLAIVTGAFSGIGLELAKLAIEQGYDLTIAADERDIHEAARTLKAQGAKVQAVQASTTEGVDQRYDASHEQSDVSGISPQEDGLLCSPVCRADYGDAFIDNLVGVANRA